MRRREGERGAALLTVLLLVAIISVIAATALERVRLSTRLATNAAGLDQARAYAGAAETLALVRVGDLLARQPARITLDGGWSGRPFGLPLPGGGTATARVSDGGNCFNLNGLVTESDDTVYAAYRPATLQFARLMKLVGVGASDADRIAAAATDWIDSDSAPLPNGGAEDEAYLSGETPYRAGNTLMTDVSELRAVRGVTAEIYARVRPWLCALPQATPSAINVNTLLPEQAPLFAMLLPDTMGVAQAQSLLLRRPPGGYGDTSTFWNGPSASGITPGPDAMGQTAVVTKWFKLDIDVTFGGTTLEEHGVIDATRLPPRLVSRQWGEPS